METQSPPKIAPTIEVAKKESGLSGESTAGPPTKWGAAKTPKIVEYTNAVTARVKRIE